MVKKVSGQALLTALAFKEITILLSQFLPPPYKRISMPMLKIIAFRCGKAKSNYTGETQKYSTSIE